jgi:hypothetical protein
LKIIEEQVLKINKISDNKEKMEIIAN